MSTSVDLDIDILKTRRLICNDLEYPDKSANVGNLLAQAEGNKIGFSDISIDGSGGLDVPSLTVNGIIYPTVDGSPNQILATDGLGNLTFVNSLSTPGSSTDNAIARFDGTGGNMLQNSLVTINDTGLLTTPFLISSGLVYPTLDGTSGQVLATDGSGNITFVNSLSTPGSSTDNAIVRFDGVTGNAVQNSLVTIDDTGLLTTQSLISSGLVYPTSDGTANQVLKTDGSGNITFTDTVSSSTTSTDNSIPRFDGTTGNIIQNSLVTVSDTGLLTSPSLIAGGLTYPTSDGTANQVLKTDGLGNITFGNSVLSSEASTNNALARYDGVTGNLIKNSLVTVNDSGILYSNGLVSASLVYPTSDGTSNQVLKTDGLGNLTFTDTLSGAGLSTDNAIARFDGTSGNIIQNSLVTVSNTGLLTTPSLVAGGLVYPTSDGTANQVLKTDGSGSLSFISLPAMLLADISATVTTNLTVGNHIKFNSILHTNSSNITLDTVTAYTTTANVNSLGRILLTGSKKYYLECVMQQYDRAGGGNYELQWYNADTTVAIGKSVRNESGFYGAFIIRAIFSPVSNTRVELRIISEKDVTNYSKVFLDIKELVI